MLRAAGLPYLCSNQSGVANYTYDCYDIEQTGDDLVVSKILLEVDSRFSEYAECNVNSTTGEYYCECRAPLPPNVTHHHHHHWPTVPCNDTVGKIAVVNESGWAHEYPDPTDPYTSAYRCTSLIIFVRAATIAARPYSVIHKLTGISLG